MRAQRGCRWSRTALATPGGSAVDCLCDQRPCLAGQEKNGMLLHQSPYLPTCKAKANEGVFVAEEQSVMASNSSSATAQRNSATARKSQVAVAIALTVCE